MIAFQSMRCGAIEDLIAPREVMPQISHMRVLQRKIPMWQRLERRKLCAQATATHGGERCVGYLRRPSFLMSDA
jgi:hypothetical protein